MINQYLEDNKERFLQELIELLKIPSISADEQYKADVDRTADFILDHLKNLGVQNVEKIETAGHPVVFGEHIIGEDLPTILVYGHYDVQPPDPLELWDSAPFEPVIKETDIHPQGAIFARGACDDKGQLFMHFKAFEAMVKTNTLNCNVKFLIEGEEEVGSVNLPIFVDKYRERLKADVVLVSDTGMIANDVPSICTGLRGISYLEVEVEGPNRDLHSGLYGGAVANPINVLTKMIASLHDDEGKITVKGMYDDVLELSNDDRTLLDGAPFSEEEYCNEIGILKSTGEKGYTTRERASIRPTLDVNGIWGGYIGEGAKTVIPSKAHAKISMRLVPNQTSEKITELFKNHFESIAPDTVKVKVKPHHGGEPAVITMDSIEYKAASLAMKETFGKEPYPERGGGSIPLVEMFERKLGLKTVLLGFGLDSDAIHSPNEHYGLFNFYKGIETIPLFYKHYAELKK